MTKKKFRKKSINVSYGRNKKQLDSFEDDVVAHFSVNVGFQTNVRGVKYVPPPRCACKSCDTTGKRLPRACTFNSFIKRRQGEIFLLPFPFFFLRLINFGPKTKFLNHTL